MKLTTAKALTVRRRKPGSVRLKKKFPSPMKLPRRILKRGRRANTRKYPR
jgi:hypothetical protein